MFWTMLLTITLSIGLRDILIDALLESLSAGELDIEVLKEAHEPTTVQAVK